jgi:hypothetical protein
VIEDPELHVASRRPSDPDDERRPQAPQSGAPGVGLEPTT